MKLLIRLLIFTVIVTIFTTQCAREGHPEGGPKDSIPPMVVRTTPAPYSTNFNGKKINIEFNEYIQLREAQKMFFISPPGEKKPRLTIKGKSVEVLFEEKLDSATTYRLDFGNSIVDNNEGNPLKGYSFVFSTGNVIDSLAMAGQTISAYERDSVFNSYIFYFDAKADSIKADSTLHNARAEALFRTDSSGYFIADILKDKAYKIYAIDDKNGNQKYDPGVDRVGFIDRTFNPTELEGFTMVYDSVKKHMQIDPIQMKFELFMEIPAKRQLVLSKSRPHRQKLMMTFTNANPTIDSLTLGGIEPEWIIRENGIVGDTVTLWIAPPTKEKLEALQDTIKGFMSIEKYNDSLKMDIVSREDLLFTHRKPQAKDAKKEARKEAQIENTKKNRKNKKETENQIPADSTATVNPEGTEPEKDGEEEKKPEEKPANPFSFKVNAANPLIPDKHISFDFTYPLRSIDSSRIELYHIQKIEGRGRDAKTEKREVKMPFTLSQSASDIKHWVIQAKWKADEEYTLMIPSKVFEDITFESNDTLKSTFKIANPDKFGDRGFKIAADTTDNNVYIFELIEGNGKNAKIITRQKNVKPGDNVRFSYLKAGTYYLRIVRDENANGKWDTGSLTLRRQPEKVRMLTNDKGVNMALIAKENWSIDENIDLKKIFGQ